MTTRHWCALAIATAMCGNALAVEPSVSCKGQVELPNQHYRYELDITIQSTKIVGLRWETFNAIGDVEPRQCSMNRNQFTAQDRRGDAYQATLKYLGNDAQIDLRAIDAKRFRLSMPVRPDAWCGGTGAAVIPVDIDFTARSCELFVSTRATPARKAR